MSIEKITSKILGEAEAAGAEVLAEANTQADAILKAAEEKASLLLESGEASGLLEKEKIVSRRKSVADIDCRKVILQQKQDLIEQSFEKAAEAITAMAEEDYLNLLAALGKRTGLKEGLLIFNQKEKETIGQKLADKLNGEVEGGAFAVAEETRRIRGGYLLQSGKVYINNTIEALVDEHREALTGEVAAMLFSGK